MLWIVDMWHKMHFDIIVCALHKCGMSSALDGTEDDCPWDDSDNDEKNNNMKCMHWWLCTSHWPFAILLNLFHIYVHNIFFPNPSASAQGSSYNQGRLKVRENMIVLLLKSKCQFCFYSSNSVCSLPLRYMADSHEKLGIPWRMGKLNVLAVAVVIKLCK